MTIPRQKPITLSCCRVISPTGAMPVRTVCLQPRGVSSNHCQLSYSPILGQISGWFKLGVNRGIYISQMVERLFCFGFLF
jgi:hypothetical protein